MRRTSALPAAYETRGATVLVSARKADHARTAAKDLSTAGEIRALEIDLDVADDTSVQAAAAALERDPGRLDVLINNGAAYGDWAGPGLPAPARRRPAGAWDIDPDRWKQRACTIAGGPLTRDEWEELLPRRRYEPACR